MSQSKMRVKVAGTVYEIDLNLIDAYALATVIANRLRSGLTTVVLATPVPAESDGDRGASSCWLTVTPTTELAFEHTPGREVQSSEVVPLVAQLTAYLQKSSQVVIGLDGILDLS